MSTGVHISNLPFSVTEAEVRELFEVFGPVERVKLATDRRTGRPRGFGDVTMADEVQAWKAITNLDGQELLGRPLKVSIKLPRGKRPDPKSR